MWLFAIWIGVLIFALTEARERSTRIFIVCCIALNACAIAMAWTLRDLQTFHDFQRMWNK